MIKRTFWSVAVVLLCFCVVISGGAWYFSGKLLYPAQWPCETEHFVFCKTPAEIGLVYEDVVFTTEDGMQLSGWFIQGDNRQAGIVLVHGRGATRHEGLRDAIALHKAGFSLLLPDLRNSGQSQKSFNSMGYHEQKDVHAAVRFLQAQGISKIGIVGYSMGATTSIMAMADNPALAAGWFDSGFSDLDSIIQERGRRDYGLPAMKYFSPLVQFFYGWRGAIDTQQSPLKVIASIAPRPVMIVHGNADQSVNVRHGRALFAAAAEPKQFWEVPGGRHTRTWQADKEKSARLITAFFKNALAADN